MPDLVAAIRPDEWNLPLLLHILGASVLVGGLSTALVAQLLGWRPTAPAGALLYARVAFRSLLLVALPGWILMRVAGQWIASEEGFGEDDPAWIGVGYITSEAGVVLLAIAIVLAGLGARRLRRGAGEANALVRVAGVLTGILVAAYIVAVWAMTTKPD